MAANEPYSKSEIDAKLETSEERIDHKFTKLLSELRLDLNRRDDHFMQEFIKINKDINWLKAVTMTILGLLLSILVAAAIKSLVRF